MRAVIRPLLVLMLLPTVCIAENRVILFGGADSTLSAEDGIRNQFLDGMVAVTRSYRDSGWNVRAMYDGIESRCELPASSPDCSGHGRRPQCCPSEVARWNGAPIAGALSIPPEELARAERANLIAELTRARDELRPGDQLLLHINTHGGLTTDGDGATHGVFCASGRGTWCTEMTCTGSLCGQSCQEESCRAVRYDDPEIIGLLTSMRNNGVGLGFAVDSCHSGAAIPAFADLGCIITSAPPDENAYSSGMSEWYRVTSEYSETSPSGSQFYPDFTTTMADLMNRSREGDRSVTLEDPFVSEMTRWLARCMDGSLPETTPDPQISGYGVMHAEDVPVASASIDAGSPCPNSAHSGVPLDPETIAEIDGLLERISPFASTSSGWSTSIRAYEAGDTDIHLGSSFGATAVAGRDGILAKMIRRQSELDSIISSWQSRAAERSLPLRIPLPAELRGYFAVNADRLTALNLTSDAIESTIATLASTCALQRSVRSDETLRIRAGHIVELLTTAESRGTRSASELAEALVGPINTAINEALASPEDRALCAAYPAAEVAESARLSEEITRHTSRQRCDHIARRLHNYIAYRRRVLGTPAADLSPTDEASRRRLESCRNFRLTP